MLDSILGNAREVDPKEVMNELQPLLIPNEKIERAFKLVRDLYVFTNLRLVLVDKQGLTGNKVEYHSIPYSKITHFSVETAGRFDRDAELKLWVSGSDHPIEKEFKKGADIVGVQKTLAYKVLE
jgi:hypothetical protein